MQIKKEIEKMDTFDVHSHCKGSWFDIVTVNVLAGVFVLLGLNVPF